MSEGELPRQVRLRPLPQAPVTVEASESERTALAARFGVTAINRLVATVDLTEGDEAVNAAGRLEAEIVQPCAISGEDFAHAIEERIAFRFVPAQAMSDGPEIDIEIDSDEPDDIGYEGESFDLGEAIAQSLGLAIDPYAAGPDAEGVRSEVGIARDDAPTGPLADALRALKRD